jgi:hypothetical protein
MEESCRISKGRRQSAMVAGPISCGGEDPVLGW